MADLTQQPSQFDDFWKKYSPGLFSLGAGLFNRNNASNEANQRLAAARGPVYDAANAGAATTLGQAGNFNPDTYAADRFNAGEALLKPVQDRQEANLMASLRAKGQLGLGVYNPGVQGYTPTTTAVNPQMAAFYAAQAGDRANRMYNAQTQGQQYLDNLVNRAGMLQRVGAGAQQTGIAGNATLPSRATATGQMLTGVANILQKNPGIVTSGLGMLQQGADWLKNWINPQPAMDFSNVADSGDWFGLQPQASDFTDFADSGDWYS